MPHTCPHGKERERGPRRERRILGKNDQKTLIMGKSLLGLFWRVETTPLGRPFFRLSFVSPLLSVWVLAFHSFSECWWSGQEAPSARCAERALPLLRVNYWGLLLNIEFSSSASCSYSDSKGGGIQGDVVLRMGHCIFSCVFLLFFLFFALCTGQRLIRRKPKCGWTHTKSLGRTQKYIVQCIFLGGLFPRKIAVC